MSQGGPILDLDSSDDSRDLIQQAVAKVAFGARVGIVHPEGVVRILVSPVNMAPTDVPQLLLDEAISSVQLHEASNLPDWFPDPDPSLLQSARKLWPGNIHLALSLSPSKGLFAYLPPWVHGLAKTQGHLFLESTSIDSVRQIMALTPGPLVQFTLRLNAQAISEPNSLQDQLNQLNLDLSLIDRSEPAGQFPARLQWKDRQLSILDPGDIGSEHLRWLMSTSILFVCTGNTCRSPMAEALCKAMISRNLGCPPDNLHEHGIVVRSAGVSAGPGQNASLESIQALGDLGHLLEQHASQMVSNDLVNAADLIYAMTRSHRELLLMDFPELADRVELLDPDDYDIPDPYGQSLNVYKMTAEAIQEALQLRAQSWDFLSRSSEEQTG